MTYLRSDLLARDWLFKEIIWQYFAFCENVLDFFVFSENILINFPCNNVFFTSMNTMAERLNQLLQQARLDWLNDSQQQYKISIQTCHQYINSSSNLNTKAQLLSKLIEYTVESGHIYYLNGDYKSAKKQYEQTVRRDPEYIVAYSQLGLCFSKEHAYDKATEIFQLCYERSHKIVDKVHALLNLAYVYQLQKKPVNIVAEVFLKAKQIAPNDPDLLNAEKEFRIFTTSMYKKKSASFFNTPPNELSGHIILDKKILDLSYDFSSSNALRPGA